MARSLYISGVALQQRGAEAYRVAFVIGGSLKYTVIDPFAAAVTSHNHFEVSTMANTNHAGVAGSWWLPTGTHQSAEWDRHGGWEYLWWKPDAGDAYQVIERGTKIIRPSQIMWWISTANLGDLTPGNRSGSVANSLNRYEGPVNAPD